MPAKSVIFERKAEKQLPKLPPHIHKKIIESISTLSQNPLKGVKLHGELAAYYKYRVGDYRIIYRFDQAKSQLIIITVEHRQGVYK